MQFSGSLNALITRLKVVAVLLAVVYPLAAEEHYLSSTKSVDVREIAPFQEGIVAVISFEQDINIGDLVLRRDKGQLLARFDSNLDLLWTRELSFLPQACMAEGNHIYVAGAVTGGFAVESFTAEGDDAWEVQGTGQNISGFRLTSLENGDVQLLGRFMGSVRMNVGVVTSVATTTNSSELFIAQIRAKNWGRVKALGADTAGDNPTFFVRGLGDASFIGTSEGEILSVLPGESARVVNKLQNAAATSAVVDRFGALTISGRYSDNAYVLGENLPSTSGKNDAFIGRLNECDAPGRWVETINGSDNDSLGSPGISGGQVTALITSYSPVVNLGNLSLTNTSSPGSHLVTFGINGQVRGISTPPPYHEIRRLSMDEAGVCWTSGVDHGGDPLVKRAFLRKHVPQGGSLEIAFGVPCRYRTGLPDVLGQFHVVTNLITGTVSVAVALSEHLQFSHWSGSTNTTDNPVIVDAASRNLLVANFRQRDLPYFGYTTVDPNSVEIRFFGSSQTEYQFWRSTDLSKWTRILSSETDNKGFTSFIISKQSSGFFRAIQGAP